MYNITEAESIIRLALDKTKEQNQDLQFIISIQKQLEYILNVLQGKSKRNKLHKIMFGLYVAREIEDRDPSYADILYKAITVVDLMRQHKL